MHKQTNSKENRRFFIEFHSLFLDRTAVSCFDFNDVVVLILRAHLGDLFLIFSLFQNLKVPLPELVAAELGKRRRVLSDRLSLNDAVGLRTTSD